MGYTKQPWQGMTFEETCEKHEETCEKQGMVSGPPPQLGYAVMSWVRDELIPSLNASWFDVRVRGYRITFSVIDKFSDRGPQHVGMNLEREHVHLYCASSRFATSDNDVRINYSEPRLFDLVRQYIIKAYNRSFWEPS